MLTYMDFHLTYTLPGISVLTIIAWPFLSRYEICKIALICGMALVYTTPWDNYIISESGWTYPEDRLLGFIGYVPVEEYMFFIIQSILTCLWVLLCVRWSTPCSNFNFNRKTYLLIRWIPIAVLSVVTVIGYKMVVPGERTFYLGCTLCWVSPVIMFLWYGAGNFFVKNILPSAIAVVGSTAYLCWVDQIALKNNVWHINEATSFNVFAAEDLPAEEVFFFFIVNVLIVLAFTGFDKARGLMETYPVEYPLRFDVSLTYVRHMFWAFLTPEYSMHSIVTEDIRKSFDVLKVSSKSFTIVGRLFQAGMRVDLVIVNAFCEVTKNMIDSEPDVKMKILKLRLAEKFINELFEHTKSDYHVKIKPYLVNINWKQYETELTDVEMSSFRALTRIAFYLPRKPFYELLAGYQWDIDQRLIRNEADLIEYCNYVAGSVSVLWVFVIMYRCDNAKFEMVDSDDVVIDKAQKIGRVLQLVNIARDIVTDSETFGRCYVPTEYMDDEQEEVRILCTEKNPRALGDKKLKYYSTRIIQLVDKYQMDTLDAIRFLPRETRGPMLVATDNHIYRENVSAIRSSQTCTMKALLLKLNTILIGLYSLYIKSNIL